MDLSSTSLTWLRLSLPHGIGDNNNLTAFTPSGISNNAVHAGLSLPPRLFQTDSVLLHTELLMSFSHLKIWFHATHGTWAAMVVSSHGLGATSRALVSSLMSASHTFLELVKSPHAPRLVMTAQQRRSTSALQAQLLRLQAPQPSNLRSMPTDQLKPVSMSMKISSPTSQVFTTTPQDLRLVVTPSRSLVGDKRTELTTGSAQTHGAPHGVWTVSSTSNSANATLTLLPMLADLNSEIEHTVRSFFIANNFYLSSLILFTITYDANTITTISNTFKCTHSDAIPSL